MIELQFVKKGMMRKVFIRDRKITMITPEMNYQPLELDINKAARFQDENMTRLLKEIGMDNFEKYTDDNVIAKDIIDDFEKSKWRCIKGNG